MTNSPPVARTTTASLRLAPDELAAWRAAAKAEGLSLSDWLRSRVSRRGELAAEPRRSARRADAELLRQLAAIGNNLNQLARVANQGRPMDRLALLAELSAIERELSRLGGVS